MIERCGVSYSSMDISLKESGLLLLSRTKLIHLNVQSYNLSAPDGSQGHVLVSVPCVWPAGFKIVPEKLIVSAELQWKPHRSDFYSVLKWGRDMKDLVSIMKQHCGLPAETESFKDDAFQLLPINMSLYRVTGLTWVLRCTAQYYCILCWILPLDGIVTLYCVAPALCGQASLKAGDELNKLKSPKL